MVYDSFKPLSLKGSQRMCQSTVLLRGPPGCHNPASAGDEVTWGSAQVFCTGGKQLTQHRASYQGNIGEDPPEIALVRVWVKV